MNIQTLKETINKNLLTFIAGVSIFLLGTTFLHLTNQSKDLPHTIKQNYIAVLPFENKTGDEELDVIGEMAADWLTSGLHETGEGKIMAANEVNRMLASSKEGLISISENLNQQSNVHYLLDGNYYLVSDSLIFASNIKDLTTGEIVFSFPLVKGKITEATTLIEHLKQRVLGFWVTKDLAGYEKHPPVYEAYKAYLEGGKIWYFNGLKAESLMKKAIELDANFHYAAFGYAHKLISRKQDSKADSIVISYQQKKELLSPMELEFLNGLQARLYRNAAQTWRHWHSPYTIAFWSKNHVLKQRTDLLIWKYNEPQMVLDILEDVDFAQLDYDGETTTRNLYFNKLDAHHLLGQNEQALDMLRNIPFELQAIPLILGTVQRFAQLQAYEDLEEKITHYEHILATRDVPAHYLRWFAILGLLVNDEEKAKEEVRKYLAFLEDEHVDGRMSPNGFTVQELKASSYMILGDLKKAGEIIEDTVLNESQLSVLVLKGMYYAKMGDKQKAEEMIAKLQSPKKKYDYGLTEMNIAIIECWLGNEERAIDLLKTSRQLGLRRKAYFYEGDWRLHPLFDHPEFNSIFTLTPLPDVEEESQTLLSAFTVYLPYSLLALWVLLGVLLWSFYRKRTKGAKTESETESSIPQIVANEQEDSWLLELKKILDANMDDPEFSLTHICQIIGMSRAQFYRKVKTLTDLSPSVYIRGVRLEKAKELLQTSNLNISEVAYQVGFKDLSYFSRSFSEHFGLSPTEFRK